LTGLKRQATGDADNPTIVGGFPESGLNKYVGCLVRAGYSVAIAFQDGTTKERYIKEIIRLQK
jgi:DNA mismatch repair ATPase MutS